MIDVPAIAQEISDRVGPAAVSQETRDHIPTFWVAKDRLPVVLRFLKEEIDRPYKMLYDLSAIDERMKTHRDGHPESDFTVVYHLLSFDRNEYLRIKVALPEDRPCAAEYHGHLARCQLVRARSVGHVRDRL